MNQRNKQKHNRETHTMQSQSNNKPEQKRRKPADNNNIHCDYLAFLLCPFHVNSLIVQLSTLSMVALFSLILVPSHSVTSRLTNDKESI